MAKSKKAAPKKNAKKPNAAKPAKKLSAKKSSAKIAKPKAKQKAPITKKTSAKPKAAQPKKSPKSKTEDVILHHAFLDSLTKLENYWVKKAALAHKELTSLVDKQQKALLSKTHKQVEKAQQLEEDINIKREAQETASKAALKFTTLKNKIEQFEAQWSGQAHSDGIALDDNESTDIIYKQEAVKENFKTPIRHTPKEILEEEWDDAENNEEEAEDLEDIFMPQDDLSEFEVIEDFSVTNEDDLYEDDES